MLSVDLGLNVALNYNVFLENNAESDRLDNYLPRSLVLFVLHYLLKTLYLTQNDDYFVCLFDILYQLTINLYLLGRRTNFYWCGFEITDHEGIEQISHFR